MLTSRVVALDPLRRAGPRPTPFRSRCASSTVLPRPRRSGDRPMSNNATRASPRQSQNPVVRATGLNHYWSPHVRHAAIAIRLQHDSATSVARQEGVCHKSLCDSDLWGFRIGGVLVLRRFNVARITEALPQRCSDGVLLEGALAVDDYRASVLDTTTQAP